MKNEERSKLPNRIPQEVARQLGYYVYVYVDPRTETPFYVGKGRGQRALAHLSSEVETRKGQILSELAAEGREPRIDILAHDLPDEQTAFRIEAAVIDLFSLDRLANKVRGWRSITLGRWPLADLITQYAARPVTISDPVILIRINNQYTPGMPPDELYEATRYAWKLGERRDGARFALAVFEGVVREVYKIHRWRKATPPLGETWKSERWEFDGTVAAQSRRSKYLGRRVDSYLPRGGQYPIRYVNC